jgi:hypothetical protein
MAKTNLAQLPAKLYELLAALTPEERNRAVQATMVLFGDAPSQILPEGKAPQRQGGVQGATGTSHSFFESKAPANKGEMLAVAARYREVQEGAQSHSKADLKKVIVDARRNFDDRNFARDIKNARRQAGLFNLGTGRDANQLSYYGQQYVDALPDRDAASKLRRPKVGRGKRKSK